MKLKHLVVQNYRGLLEIDLPLSQFVCLTGPNNAGKSSVLQAIALFISGHSIPISNFFDPQKEIIIGLTFENITSDDLSSLISEHRERIDKLVKEGRLELVRRYAIDGKGQLGYYDLLPIEPRFQATSVSTLLKGKKGKAIVAAVVGQFPELIGQVEGVGSQEEAKTLIDALGRSLPNDKKIKSFVPIPTGSSFSLLPMLPECIYIPAVKDLADDVKTTEASSFGKVLSMVLDSIMPELENDSALFENLTRKLTRVLTDTGVVEDNRLENIKFIESTMQKFVQESFASVQLELEITPPKLQSVLSTAKIFANDGAVGPLETKGDGLRRAVVFAILRTYVEFSKKIAEDKRKAELKEEGADVKTSPQQKPRSYLLLFEEPELFLHPDSQRILFEALGAFAQSNHVLVTTHSPLFLGPGATATFVRIWKERKADIPKPFSRVVPIDLSQLDAKDEFQLICFENNNAAFFSKSVVLVEGDSDLIVFPHIAEILNPDWTSARHSIAFTQVKGKGSIRRYKSFFERFGVRVSVIADLDILLDGFEALGLHKDIKTLRARLLTAVDAEIKAEEINPPNGSDVKDAHGKGNLRFMWEEARRAAAVFKSDPAKFSELENAVDTFFAWERKSNRLEVLKASISPAVVQVKAELLAVLRQNGIFILEKGTVEDYYPTSITGADKPSKAQHFRNTLTRRDDIIACCSQVNCPVKKVYKPEFELIFESVFG